MLASAQKHPYSAILPDAIDYFRTHNKYKDWDPKKGKRVLVRGIADRKSTRLNSSHVSESRMPSSA